MKHAAFAKLLIVGILLTPVCLLLATGSAGAGHGDYFYAKLLYPYAMISVLVFDSLLLPSILFAVPQFPLYGALCGLAAAKGHRWMVGLGIIMTHALAVALCFLLLSSNFA
ncbi:MAG TPA: hypothetical protein VEY11_06460 [Pyrinomonadaceae bacterium]|nr:hypothetical protein [Pyrinomonadaceae bacterium]